MGVLDAQFTKLKERYDGAEIQQLPDGSHLVTIKNFGLPAGWNKQTTSVYFLVPSGYPFARPDCFWTDQDLRLAHGGVPTNTNQNAVIPGLQLPSIWFSYHPGSWDPNID